MKKVLFYTDTTIYGGAEHQMFLLAKFLKKQNFQVGLACAIHPQLTKWVKKWRQENLEVFNLNVKSKHDPRHFFQLRKAIKRFQPELVHIHVWNPASGRWGFLAIPKKIPLVITEHDPFELKGIKQHLKKILTSSIKGIISISKANYKLLQKIYPQQKSLIHLIPNGIDIDWIKSQQINCNQTQIQEIRESVFDLSPESEKKVCLTVAALHPRKGLEQIIELAKNFEDKVEFVIAGSGPSQNQLQAEIDKQQITNLKLIGQRQDIPKLMKSADFFLLPSPNEAFGLVLIEAMASELPVIAVANGGVTDIIQNQKNGFLSSKSSAQEFKEIIQNHIFNSDLENIKSAGTQTVEEKFTAANMATKTAELYDSIIRN